MWIESHQTLARHPKMFALCEELKIIPAQAIGHLHLFWYWCLDYAKQGDLTPFSDAAIARAADWPGDPAAFVQALVKAGFVDETREVHDWYDYAGKLIEKRESERLRLRRLRKDAKKRGLSGVRPPPVRSTDGVRTPLTNPTNQPNQPPISPPSPGDGVNDASSTGGGNIHPAPPPRSPAAPPDDDDEGDGSTLPDDPPGFGEVWSAYPEKKSRAAAVKAWLKAGLGAGDVPAVMAAIAAWKKTRGWKAGYIPRMHNWLAKGEHMDAPEDVAAGAPDEAPKTDFEKAGYPAGYNPQPMNRA